jgi:hypothetical protein
LITLFIYLEEGRNYNVCIIMPEGRQEYVGRVNYNLLELPEKHSEEL